MYDATRVIAGLAIFVGVGTFPVWYGAARGLDAAPPRVAVETSSHDCVLPVDEMRAVHPALLDDWRTTAVRYGRDTVRTSRGETVTISLTGTCLGCHANKAEFCDRCHEWAAVAPGCWDCHNVPEETR